MTLLADQLQGFPRNTRWYAAHWIVSGERHPEEHWYISERLAKWRQQAADRREELQATAQSILAEFERERAAAARPARAWVMPTDLDGADLAGADKIDAEAPGEAVDAGVDPARYTATPAPSRKLETGPTSRACARSVPQPQKNRYGKRRLVPRPARRAA